VTVTSTEPTPDVAESGPPRRHHHWYDGRAAAWAMAAVAGALQVALVVALVVWFTTGWTNREPGMASLQDALEQFRSENGGTTGGSTPLRPPEGVYTYDGSGTERLSVLDTSQQQGPQLPATVVPESDGCWRFEIEYNAHHRQDWTYCAKDGALYEHRGSTFQRFDFVAFTVDDLTEFACAPPALTLPADPEPGQTWQQSCPGHSESQGTDTVSSGTNTYVGEEELTIAGERVAAHHIRQERTISGDQAGETVEDIWFAVDDALPLRDTRTNRVESPAPAPLNSVTYTEEGTWQVASLVPQT
jgi:hypothetical protein